MCAFWISVLQLFFNIERLIGIFSVKYLREVNWHFDVKDLQFQGHSK